MNQVTIFTPTYNRAYVLERLYSSLRAQSDHNFQWLIIDDGSTDNTSKLVQSWIDEKNRFPITYRYYENGGKQRAINIAVQLIKTEYIFIVDSDDQLTEDAVEKVNRWLIQIKDRDDLAGVSGVKGNCQGQPIGGVVDFSSEYVEATNLERIQYNLQWDMAEIYKVDLLRRFPFTVWPGEKFVPEATVWDEIALQGYKLRWYRDVIYKCKYLEDGLTNNSWELLKNNPMGYAMLFNHQLLTTPSLKARLKQIILMLSCIYMADEKGFITQSNMPIMTKLLVPAGKMLYRRRRRQFAE